MCSRAPSAARALAGLSPAGSGLAALRGKPFVTSRSRARPGREGATDFPAEHVPSRWFHSGLEMGISIHTKADTPV